ncbi:CHAT domain-containing tetratricopeptide repeat protein [Flavihumibacter sp. UBA7668]|uniref:CHAT domain-containing tetratricopeptide repeat protein n=1 Tax=Flavihumibacter sp. UBA7668 TaxID=1946542 RepID=UPI0025C58DAB|nr:CHAT domain-containing protein [Flavihumibacter sp. UBA7668]
MRNAALAYCLFVPIFLIWNGFSQSSPEIEKARQVFEKAESYYNSDYPTDRSDSLALILYREVIELLTVQAPHLSIRGDAMIKRGNILQGRRKLANAATEYRNALVWFDQSGKDSALYFQACLHLGSNFYNGFKIDSARYYLEKAAALAIDKPFYPDLDVLYNSLGAMYFQSSNYLQAGNYFKKARLLLDPNSPDYKETYNGFSNNIAICHAALDQYDESLNIYQSLLKDPYLKNRVLQNIGHLFFAKGNPDSALYWFNQVQAVQSNSIVRMYHEMARIYLDKKKPEKVLFYLDEANRLNQSLGESPKERSANFLLRSRLAFNQADFKEALEFIETGLRGINENNAPLVLFELVELKADINADMYAATKLPVYLETSVKAVLQAIETASNIRKTYDNDEAKLFFNNNQHRIYHKAAELIYEWYLTTNLPEAMEAFFKVEEQYKGSVLNDQLRVSGQRAAMAGDFKPLLQEEYELKQSMAYYSSLLNTLKEEEEISRIEKEMVSTRVALSRLQNRLLSTSEKQASPDSVLSLEEFQTSLQNNLAVLSFLQTDSGLFRLVITDTDSRLDRIPFDGKLKENLQLYIEAIHTQEEGVRFKGSRSGSLLYQLLLAPVEDLIKKQEKCTILADGFLHLLPFEALPVDADLTTYFLDRKMISYHMSFAQVGNKRIPNVQGLADSSWISFAPFQEADSNIRQTGLAALPYSEEEAGFGADPGSFVKTAATKENFLRYAGNKSILHIASHASSNKDETGNSWIKFYPVNPDSILGYTLFLPEIYPLQLKSTELVILSACESANGIAASGEGLLSLSRAFLYAGSNGVIASLWKSEDQVTAYIIRSFRTELQKGNSVEAALQAAKQEFLRDPAIPVQFKQPNYWAHLIYIGNCADESAGLDWIIFGSLILAFMLVMSFVYFRNRSSSSFN